MIFVLQGNAFVAYSLAFVLPTIYAAVLLRSKLVAGLFLALGVAAAAVGVVLARLGRRHRRRLQLVESAVAMLLVYPLLAIFGALPFWVFGWLTPVDALLETVSDLTSAGISLLPAGAPYFLRLWQSVLMWFGSLIFLAMLVSVMPAVSGCFGMDLSLHGGQTFSPIFGQMFVRARQVLRVYAALTVLGVGLFVLAGLGLWDAVLLAMRCISTGGGDFFPARGNVAAEYAAAVVMLLACGNFLFYHRLAVTIPARAAVRKENIVRRGISYAKDLGGSIAVGARKFVANSEVKAAALIIFLGVGAVFLSTYRRGLIVDGNEAIRYAFFHVVSFLSTTGINLAELDRSYDFDRFLIFLMAIFGGCMGSATGGLKLVRVLVLAKVAAAELTKTMHPRMVTCIRVNRLVVPTEIIGRILGFFFLSALTLFVCSAILSFMEPRFSEAVAISVACLTNVGTLPGICEAATFLKLPAAGKIFCVAILVVGRLEIFALLIALAGLLNRRKFKEW